MKLPDFFKFEPLNDVKRKMRIPPEVYGSFGVRVESSSRLTETELNLLTSGEGIDVNFEELSVLPDGTLGFKDSRVLVYIRDVHVMAQDQGMPKYHFYNCSALVTMTESGRFDRYVVSATVDGIFSVRLAQNGRAAQVQRARLDVCKNCLTETRLKGFNSQTWRKRDKEKFVAEFVPKDFFDIYPRSLLVRKPRYDSDSAPQNEYSDDWGLVSKDAKTRAGFRCEGCGVDLSAPSLRRFLQTHHKNGLRNDNSLVNLEVLCLKCHAKMPQHSHVRNSAAYVEYTRIVPDHR
jgi:hypothetical protein